MKFNFHFVAFTMPDTIYLNMNKAETKQMVF